MVRVSCFGVRVSGCVFRGACFGVRVSCFGAPEEPVVRRSRRPGRGPLGPIPIGIKFKHNCLISSFFKKKLKTIFKLTIAPRTPKHAPQNTKHAPRTPKHAPRNTKKQETPGADTSSDRGPYYFHEIRCIDLIKARGTKTA